MKIAFITGINGQDGSYLSEFLLEKNYYVYGIIRRKSSINTERIDHLYNDPKFKLFYGDMTDLVSITNVFAKIFKEHNCDEIDVFEIYNLAAQSHVMVSFSNPDFTTQVNAIGTMYLLETINSDIIPLPKDKIKFYQACTSEMYGENNDNKPMNELTPFNPVSPYAISKLASYYFVRMYRLGHNLHASNGILMNHESPRRGETFVTRKIVIGVKKIMKGVEDFIELGNLDAYRDWGHAKDYIEAMWLMLQQDKPGDFVIGTGTSHSVRDFVEEVFKYYNKEIVWEGEGVNEIGKEKDTGIIRIKINEKYFRPVEVPYLQADPSKAKTQLGWKPKTTFDMLVKDMIENEDKA